MRKKPAVRKETLETIEDDVQLRIDKMFDRIKLAFKKEAAAMKETELRAVCVEHSHVDASVIKEIYERLLGEAFNGDTFDFTCREWIKILSMEN